ncbi:hypothetical protein ACHM2L_15990, partial [Clostridium perfringens]|uniref:hypothetical protein n=1 Tax=Clostridium perfringens TaxID=1502 RepID=UPI003754F19A
PKVLNQNIDEVIDFYKGPSFNRLGCSFTDKDTEIMRTLLSQTIECGIQSKGVEPFFETRRSIIKECEALLFFPPDGENKNRCVAENLWDDEET